MNYNSVDLTRNWNNKQFEQGAKKELELGGKRGGEGGKTNLFWLCLLPNIRYTTTRLLIDHHCGQITMFIVRMEQTTLGILPVDNWHKIRDKTWKGALDQSIISDDDILLVCIGFVRLVCN